MQEKEEVFSDQDAAPCMEFQEEHLQLLGESERDSEKSEWKHNKDRGTLSLDSFGTEFEFNIATLTDNQPVLTDGDDSEIFITLVL